MKNKSGFFFFFYATPQCSKMVIFGKDGAVQQRNVTRSRNGPIQLCFLSTVVYVLTTRPRSLLVIFHFSHKYSSIHTFRTPTCTFAVDAQEIAIMHKFNCNHLLVVSCLYCIVRLNLLQENTLHIKSSKYPHLHTCLHDLMHYAPLL